MKNKILRIALALGFIILGQAALLAQQIFTTTIYLDYTCFLTNKGPITAPPPGNPNFMNNFFTFRRAYFRYENKISDNLKFRLTYDAEYVKAVDASGKKDDKLRPFIKHLNFEWSNLIPNSSIKVGMTDTLTFKLAEDRWGYRSVVKTLTDGYKDVTGADIDASSSDLGATITGSISKGIRYGFMVANGAGYAHPEGDRYKKLAAQLQLIPIAGFSVVGYIDYEKQDSSNKAFTYKADSYLEIVRNLVIGAEYFVYDNDKNLTADLRHYDISGLSLFGRYTFKLDVFSIFARFDRYEPNSKNANDQTSLVIAGFDWAPLHKSLRIQPNIWFYTYADPTKKDDAIFNLTFFLSF
jgi:hypothetical protein